jgi:hypothetical protein
MMAPAEAERLLTAGSLVRVRPGEPNFPRTQLKSSRGLEGSGLRRGYEPAREDVGATARRAASSRGSVCLVEAQRGAYSREAII